MNNSTATSILGNLDECIENCHSEISKIRTLLEAIYSRWFLQFDFPWDDGKGYKSHGGQMQWNTSLKKHIPRGWTVGVLSDCANVTMGQSPVGSSYNVDGKGILFFQGATDFGEVYPIPRQYTTAPTRFAQAGDILLSVRAPVGTMNITLDNCCIGRGLAAIRGKGCCNTFIEITLKNFAKIFSSKNGDGTTFGSLSKNELYGLPLVIPTHNVLQRFSDLAEPLEHKVSILAKKIIILTQQRNWFLPMLMNGQITVER